MSLLPRMNWLGIVAEFVRLRPKTSAAIAFELGILAAQAVSRVPRTRQVSRIPSTLIELAPSLGDLGYLPNRRTRSNAPKRKKSTVKRSPRVKKASQPRL